MLFYDICYDKASGLWIFMNSTSFSGERSELLLVETNIPIGIQYEHDLGVTLEAPLRLKPGETTMLKATVYNLGLSNESNIEIQILINSTVFANAVINLNNCTCFTLSCYWTPTIEGIYNITAYAPPVTDENVTINNVASRIVNVRSIDVALISAYSELTAITPILDSMGIDYDIYNNNNMYLYTQNITLLLDYKAVIFYNRGRSITSSEYSALESYLSSGGTILVTGYDCLLSDTLLASLVRSSSIGDNIGESDLIVIDDTHPIMNGLYGSFPAGYRIYGLGSDCDKAEADTARNAVTVAELADGYDKIIATEGIPGKVVFWNGDGTYDWSENSNCQKMLKNLIHWFVVGYEHELVVTLQAPIFLEPGGSAMLNATVKNNGLSDEADVCLKLSINGTVVNNVTIPLLSSGASYTMNYLWAPATTGGYNITVWAPPILGETITENNIRSKLVIVQYAPRILAYTQYTDYYQDYKNTLNAINSKFGPNYILTELNDYTQLATYLSGKDILLIPDQENASFSLMEMIGEAWRDTLSEFLENGGTIILCDGRYGYGGTYGILTGADLMQISSANYKTLSTLYLVDPTDPLAEGVSTSFQAPPYTVSFVTAETNVVINDGTYPVVIHKIVDKGCIALLGFDFELVMTNTKQILANAIKLAIHITISASLSVGSPSAEVEISGTKATPNGIVLIYWDYILIGNTTANIEGNFVYLLTVPENASVGIHEIRAVDIAADRTASMFFRVIQITLNPSEGPMGTKVTVKGSGFLPSIQTTITFNDMLIGYTTVNSFGNFTFTFNIPLSTAGVQAIKAFETEGNYAFAMFKVIDFTSLEITMDVGALYFTGEIAEFYVQTTFKGQAVNATVTSAVLYKPDGATEPLTAQLITTGFYKIVYNILENTTGTYTLVVTANYVTDTIEAYGTTFKCFLLSSTLTYMNAHLVEIKENITTIMIPDLRIIKLNLTAINPIIARIDGNTVDIKTDVGIIKNVTLIDIQLKVTAINGTTVTIHSMLGVMNGTITTIKNNIATIVIPGVGQIEADISSFIGVQESWIIPQYATVILALIAAASSTLLLIFIRRKKPAEAK